MATKIEHYEEERVEDVEIKVSPVNARARLVPRPSEDPADPLNWPMKLKLFILFEVCWLAFVSFNLSILGITQFTYFPGLQLGTWNTSSINPAYSLLAKDLHVTAIQASYQTYGA